MKPLLLIAFLSLALAACGGDDAVSAEDANRLAGELAEETKALSEDVTDPADAREDLEALREQLSSQAP